jgi:ATP-dependent DNA helicase RecG
VRLPRLALAIVDEQHRFGVRQRARLRRMEQDKNDWKMDEQGGMVPHLLVLSATPIPRSLALTSFGDLDLVTLRDLPPGRKPIITRVCVGTDERKSAYAAVEAAVAEAGQAFVVCPAIDQGGISDEAPTSAVGLARELRDELAPARIGLLHGKLAPDKQRSVVEKLRAGALDVLVAPSILEVGVDVPHAKVMVIEDADRFGLAQLHQLRGRVGRGGQQGHCYLVTRTSAPEAARRLSFLAATGDGFRIALEDLRRRGAGDLQGTRQTGLGPFLDPAFYAEHVEMARRQAEAVLAVDPELAMPAHEELSRAALHRLSQARPIAEEAG